MFVWGKNKIHNSKHSITKVGTFLAPQFQQRSKQNQGNFLTQFKIKRRYFQRKTQDMLAALSIANIPGPNLNGQLNSFFTIVYIDGSHAVCRISLSFRDPKLIGLDSLMKFQFICMIVIIVT